MTMESSLKTELTIWKNHLKTLVHEFQNEAQLKEKQVLIIGCSTSEVIGEQIGSAGTDKVAEVIFDELSDLQSKTKIELAFQCCEHLNRAIVVERETAERKNYGIVSVIPVRTAGGAMAAYAYRRFNDPVVVEQIQADAGIDIGDTFIGMHLKQVAVPIRTSIKEIGSAHVTMAKTRPKLIGGERAIYKALEENKHCT